MIDVDLTLIVPDDDPDGQTVIIRYSPAELFSSFQGLIFSFLRQMVSRKFSELPRVNGSGRIRGG